MVPPPALLRRLHCIAAMDTKRGIGKNGDLPWSLPKELKTFAKITSTVKCDGKQNAVIMGRLTYFSIPEKFRPLRNRLNVVLSSTLTPQDVPDNVLVARSLDECVQLMSDAPYKDTIENLFVIGGSSVYSAAMSSQYCGRIYLTEVCGDFSCDTFFPAFDKNVFKTIDVPGLCLEEQEENGVKYQLHVYSSE